MKIAKVHYLTQDGVGNLSHAELAEDACKGGADWVQLRMKSIGIEYHVQIARAVQKVCTQYGATFIINDNVALAKKVGADGVHIGKNDMRPDLARKELGPDVIIGATANSLEDAERMAAFDIDYLGVGPFKFTTTKENLAPVMGASGIAEVVQALPNMPVIAIGGIIPDDIPQVLETGAHGFALCSVVNSAEDRTGKMKEIIEKSIVA